MTVNELIADIERMTDQHAQASGVREQGLRTLLKRRKRLLDTLINAGVSSTEEYHEKHPDAPKGKRMTVLEVAEAKSEDVPR